MNDERLEAVNCDLCGSEEYDNVLVTKDYYNGIEGQFTIVRCKSCGLYYTNPRPKESRINEFYPDDAGYYQPVLPDVKSSKFEKLKKILINFYNYPGTKANKIDKAILYLTYLLNKKNIAIQGIPYFDGKQMLDIGCSYGGYLYKMRELGYDVEGVELNTKASEYANKELKIKVHNISIDEFETDKKYDVVYMGMVMEHVLSVSRALKKINSLLKKNGQLIFSIPDFNGLERKIFGKYCYTLHMPAHITHFDEYSVKKYLNKNGFELVKIVHQKSPKDFIYSFKNMGEKNSFYLGVYKVLDNKFIRKLLIQPVVSIISLFGKTSRMTVYAKKS